VIYRVTYTEPAEQDIATAFDWFSRQSSAVSESFLRRISLLEQFLTQAPLMYTITRHDIRCAYLLPFRYGLYYRVVADEVIVIGCLHASRRPRLIWKTLSTR